MKYPSKYRFEKRFDTAGFTLIEMAIVLIIIGIIIGAVVKGKDLIRSGEQKKIYTKFINSWQTAYLVFYDRTGRILGDTHDGSSAGQNGHADTSAGDGTKSAGDEAELCESNNSNYYGLVQVGIDCPTTNTTKSYTYNYTDSEGSGHTLTIAFLFDSINNYNYMAITGMVTELALAMDTLIDGKAEGTEGDFLNGSGTTNWGLDPTTEIPEVRWKMQI